MAGGAPFGNNNAGSKHWRAALDRAIAQDNGVRLRAAVEKLLDMAAAGEPWAVRELADRLDGRPAQDVSMSAQANPLDGFTHKELRAFVNAMIGMEKTPLVNET